MREKLKSLGRLIKRCLLAISHQLARVNTALLMIFSFYLLLVPIGFIRRLFLKPTRGWRVREPLKREHFEKQY
ncbi:MAG TPA: hypothetical protein VKZ59_02790 [Acidobacteriota bacterium]|nr:hypothetical protein [Acidobacteriota bacterium]